MRLLVRGIVSRSARFSWIALALGLPALSAEGQTHIPSPVERTSLRLHVEKPFFPDGGAFSAYSSILRSDVLLPMGSGTLQIGVPLALGGADGIDAGSGFLGNLHATLLFGEPGALSSYVGITLPTASELSGPGLGQIVGVLPSLDEPEAWFEDMVALRGGFAPSRTLGQRGSVGLRIGGAALAPTGWENLFVYARFAGWASTQLERARLGADLQTSYAINDDDGFGQQFSSYLDLSAALTNASGQPGVFVRLPLDGDARQLLDVLIGLSAQF